MLLTGPNGSGKSTLLAEIARSGHPTHIGRCLYVGPDRNINRTFVSQAELLQGKIDVLARLRPQTEGTPEQNFRPFDLLKKALGQISFDLNNAVASYYLKNKKIELGEIPDPWEPLRDLTSSLLPHMNFLNIELDSSGGLKCMWNVHDDKVELDDLSSGEKSVIQLAFPIVEHRIRTILAKITGLEHNNQREIAVLIDEPELHLHPNLQLKILDFYREEALKEDTQVILATHSPTMVENASCEELFLLRPKEACKEGENQLGRIADDEEKLQVLRELFGSTSNLTAMRPIVVVEGTKRSDTKLYGALHTGFRQVTVIPGGGKGECKALLENLRPALKLLHGQLNAVALLDRDHDSRIENGIHLLPVAMIENLLLDPKAIWEAIQSVLDETQFSSQSDVSNAIDQILDSLENEEIERRAIFALGDVKYFRPQRPIEGLETQVRSFSDQLLGAYGSDKIRSAMCISAERIKEIKDSTKRRENFHGKTILDHFFKKHLHKSGMKKEIFIFESARHARDRSSVSRFFNDFFESLKAGTV